MTQENPPKNTTEEYEGKRLNFQDLPEEEQQEHLRSLETLKLKDKQKAEKDERLYEKPSLRQTDATEELVQKTEELKNLIPQTVDSSLGSKADANLEGKTIWKKEEVINEVEPRKEKGFLGFLKRNWKKGLMVGGFTILGAAASEKAHASGDPMDSLNKKNSMEKGVGEIKIREGLQIHELTGVERQEWNDFIGFVQAKEKELGGLEKLDKNQALARKLFMEYQKIHPGTTINYGIVASVQYEMQKLKQNAQGFAERHNDPNANKLMGFISEVDGLFGDNTAKSTFPFMIQNQYHNENLVSSKNVGLVNANFESESSVKNKVKVPKGAKLEKLADGTYYENEDGDMVKVSDN